MPIILSGGPMHGERRELDYSHRVIRLPDPSNGMHHVEYRWSAYEHDGRRIYWNPEEKP